MRMGTAKKRIPVELFTRHPTQAPKKASSNRSFICTGTSSGAGLRKTSLSNISLRNLSVQWASQSRASTLPHCSDGRPNVLPGLLRGHLCVCVCVCRFFDCSSFLGLVIASVTLFIATVTVRCFCDTVFCDWSWFLCHCSSLL